jgi:hypothetical protein
MTETSSGASGLPRFKVPSGQPYHHDKPTSLIPLGSHKKAAVQALRTHQTIVSTYEADTWYLMQPGANVSRAVVVIVAPMSDCCKLCAASMLWSLSSGEPIAATACRP